MGRKINLESFLIFILFGFLSMFFYYQIFFGKIPFNGNLLVAFWSPWKYQQWTSFPSGVPFKFMAVDEIREFYPLLDFNYDNIKNGQIPLWNPYNFSGYPNLANWASAVFYPLHLVFFFLNKIQSFIFLKLSAIALSGIFMYFYLNSLKLDKRSSFLGGIMFAFSSTLIIWGAEIWQAAHSIIWLPLVLLAIERFLEKKKISYVILGAAGLALSMMAGYMQPTIYIYLFSGIYALSRVFILKKSGTALSKKTIKDIFYICLMFMFSMLFSAVQLLPGIESFFLSPRRVISLTDLNLSFLLPLNHLLTFFVPDIFGHFSTQNWFSKQPGQYYEQMVYIGVVPLVLTSVAFLHKKYRNYIIFFFLFAVISLLGIFNLPTSHLVYKLNVPFLSTAIPIRIIFITVFCFSALSAIGIDWWLKNKARSKKIIISMLPLTIIYFSIGFWLLSSYMNRTNVNNFPPNWYITSARNFIIPFAVFASSVFVLIVGIFINSFKKYLYFLILGIVIIHSFIFIQKYLSFTKKDFFYPKTALISYVKNNIGTSRYFGYGEAALANNFTTVYKLYSPEGYDPVNIKRYNELLSSVNTGNLKGMASRSDALIPNFDGFPTEDKNYFRLKMLDLLGVKYVGYFSKETNLKKPENDHFKLIWRNGNFMIFENKKTMDRAFLVPEASFVKEDSEIIKKIFDKKTDLSREVILEEKVNQKTNSKSEGYAKITGYSPNQITIKVSSNSPQFLVLTDTYYPGWEATVNGSPTKVYRADYTFRAIQIPKGENEVVFSYKPKSFYIGLIVSISSILFAIGLCSLAAFKKKLLRL